MLIQLTYASRTKGVLGPADIKDILGASQRNNTRLGVTGALCLNAQSMMVLGFSSTQGGKSAYQIVWGAAVRPLLPVLPLVQQGIAFDAANNRLVAGPAQISIL